MASGYYPLIFPEYHTIYIGSTHASRSSRLLYRPAPLPLVPTLAPTPPAPDPTGTPLVGSVCIYQKIR